MDTKKNIQHSFIQMLCKKWPRNIMLFVHLVRKSDNFTSSCLVVGILTDNALQNVKTPISNLKTPLLRCCHLWSSYPSKGCWRRQEIPPDAFRLLGAIGSETAKTLVDSSLSEERRGFLLLNYSCYRMMWCYPSAIAICCSFEWVTILIKEVMKLFETHT